MLKNKNKYWQKFYQKNQAPQEASNFCFTVDKELNNNSTIIDIGCGNFRDSNFFSLRHNVIGVDGNSNIEFANPKVFFIPSFIENLPDIKCECVYSRFFIHAIPEDVEDLFWEYIKRNANRFFIEARSDIDSFDGNHYRRFINKNKIQNKLKKLGFEFTIIEDKGLAVHQEEDPCVIRIIGKVL